MDFLKCLMSAGCIKLQLFSKSNLSVTVLLWDYLMLQMPRAVNALHRALQQRRELMRMFCLCQTAQCFTNDKIKKKGLKKTKLSQETKLQRLNSVKLSPDHKSLHSFDLPFGDISDI